MDRKKIFTKKKVTGVAALVVALAIIITGTFAWKDFSQFANSLFKADATVSNHWISLVDDFQSATTTGTNTKTLTNWKRGVPSIKKVYVTSDPDDTNVTDKTGYDASSTNYAPVYVRVKLAQRLTIGGVDASQADSTNVSKNQYPTQIAWTKTGTITPIADWVTGGSFPDAHWIQDSDGWLYWAEPLEFGDKTDNLLDSVELLIEPEKALEYTVDVTLQAVSADLDSTTGETGTDYLGGFEDWGIAYNAPIRKLFPDYGYTIESNTQIMKIGETLPLTLSRLPRTKATPTATWSSSDTAIATVDSAGLVSAVANGIVTITATVDGTPVTVNMIVTTAAGTFTDTNAASTTIWRVLTNDDHGNVLIITEHVYNYNPTTPILYNTTNVWSLYESSNLKNNATTGMDAWYTDTNNVSSTLKGIALDYAYQDNEGNLDTNKGIADSGAGVERTSNTVGIWNGSATNKKAITVPGDIDTKGIGSEKVFALSVSEANVYFGVGTANNANRIATDTSGTARGWGLRSPGTATYPASLVASDGNVRDEAASFPYLGFRVALWIHP